MPTNEDCNHDVWMRIGLWDSGKIREEKGEQILERTDSGVMVKCVNCGTENKFTWEEWRQLPSERKEPTMEEVVLRELRQSFDQGRQ